MAEMSRITHLLNITVNTKRQSQSTDDYGNVSDGPPSNLTSEPARRHRLREARVINDDKRTYVITDEFHFEPGTDVIEGDIIIYDSQEFSVYFVDNPHGLSWFLIAQCEALKGNYNG